MDYTIAAIAFFVFLRILIAKLPVDKKVNARDTLTDDIMTEVLSHANMTTVMKIRATCKSWRRNVRPMIVVKDLSETQVCLVVRAMPENPQKNRGWPYRKFSAKAGFQFVCPSEQLCENKMNEETSLTLLIRRKPNSNTEEPQWSDDFYVITRNENMKLGIAEINIAVNSSEKLRIEVWLNKVAKKLSEDFKAHDIYYVNSP
jgi:hypothetical protein